MHKQPFSIALLVSFWAGAALAQNTNSGDIRGTATDITGGTMPGVTVVVTDVDKGVTHTYVTDSAGLYDTGSIVPDRYTVTFSKDGFDTYVRGPITVHAGEMAVNVKLNVGQVSQTVVVSADVPLLETESAAQSTTMNSKSMEQLPQVGILEDWEALINLLPGTASVPGFGNNSASPGIVAVSVNGSLPYSSVLMDGAAQSLPQSNNMVPVIFDAISEVKISDSLFPAEYGVGGIIYNQITKGGSGQFHGELYDYFQNTALNAAPYSFGVKAKVPVLHYNEAGGNIGGPILKKRMFFFFDYDQIVDNGGAANGFLTVPTAAMKTGDFTGMATIYDPTTQTIDAAGVVHRQSFATEYGNGNKIPASMIDPVAKAIDAYYPAPNIAGTLVNGIPTNNYFYNFPSPNPFTRYFGRLDYDVVSNNRLTISEAWTENPALMLRQGLCPINCNTNSEEDSTAQVSDVWTLRPNTINELRFGFTDSLLYDLPYSLNAGFPAKLGWKFAKADVFPGITISGEYALSPAVDTIYKQMSIDPSDVLTMIRGRQVLHFGAEFPMYRLDSTPFGNLNGGKMDFNGNYTASTQGTSNTTGSGHADFLLGQSDSWSASVQPEYGARLKFPQLFIEDDIKMRTNLTVNLGLRWMGETGWSEVKGNERSFDPTVLNPVTSTLGAEWYGVTHANGRTSLQKPTWHEFMPRFGFAYQPIPNMAISGGFGVYAYPWSADTYAGGVGAAFGSIGSEGDSTNGVLPVVVLSSDGSTNYQGAAGASVNSKYLNAPRAPESYNGQAVSYSPYDSAVPNVYQWNLAIQRELSTNAMLAVAYVASHGANEVFALDLNQVPEKLLGPNDATGATNMRPYPHFQGISGSKPVGISNYNSLQASLEKRMSDGLEFNVNYTWSHFLDEQDSSGQSGRGGPQTFQNAYLPSANYGPSNFDIRHAFKGQVVYQLPFGKGQRFLNYDQLLNQVVGGWRASATVVLQSGNPFTVVMANNTSFSQAGSLYPNVVGDPKLSNPSTDQWFNIAAFAAPLPAAFGNSHRNSVYGPGLTDVNFSMGKSFPIRDKVLLKISADATNVLNHPSFALPDRSIGPGHKGQITGVTIGGRGMQLIARITF